MWAGPKSCVTRSTWQQLEEWCFGFRGLCLCSLPFLPFPMFFPPPPVLWEGVDGMTFIRGENLVLIAPWDSLQAPTVPCLGISVEISLELNR